MKRVSAINEKKANKIHYYDLYIRRIIYCLPDYTCMFRIPHCVYCMYKINICIFYDINSKSK